MIFSELKDREHEQLAFFSEPHKGYRAIIAVHNTKRGPGLGGCRFRKYACEDLAVDDVLRLSEGMSYKNALADMQLGGGKACLLEPEKEFNRTDMFRWFGACVERMGGCYITAEDMGTSVDDMAFISEKTTYVTGVAGKAGDPSPWTASGVFLSLQTACEKVFGSKDVSNKRVAVQGAGHVGLHLIRHLVSSGAKIICADSKAQAIADAKSLGAQIVAPEEIYQQKCDIFSPNAMGQTINSETISKLQCKIICGAANNQLTTNEIGNQLVTRGILYCPDFVINSGGVINVGAELVPGGYNAAWVKSKVDNIPHTLKAVFAYADKNSLTSAEAAISLAKEKLK